MPSFCGFCSDFNPEPSRVLFLDINSCFAAVEQQANPVLRGKPVVVAAYPTPNGCILAASVEAKKLGIRTGMRVKDGRSVCPELTVLPSDPPKYRAIHLRLRELLSRYSPEIVPRSIDEFCLKPINPDLWSVAREIKQGIKEEIGEVITVSIGIAPNRYLAKLASSLQKPDGLVEINKNNYQKVYQSLELRELTGIKTGNIARLNLGGIYTAWNFYRASPWDLKAAFKSVVGFYWFLRLHGYEVDDFVSRRGSFGNSFALPTGREDPYPILAKLVAKTGVRLRRAGYGAQGIHLGIFYRDGSFWHRGLSYPEAFFDSRDIFKKAALLLQIAAPVKPIREMAVSVFDLERRNSLQLNLFADAQKKSQLVASIDAINLRWGDFTLIPAIMLRAKELVPDRIGFQSCPQP